MGLVSFRSEKSIDCVYTMSHAAQRLWLTPPSGSPVLVLRMEPTSELLQLSLNLLDQALGAVCSGVRRSDLLEEDAPVWVTHHLKTLEFWASETFASLYTAP